MKHKIVLLLVFSLIIGSLLAGCKGASNAASSTANASGTGSSQSSTSLSQANKLLVGTLKLDNTDNAIAADKAVQLLPLWQAYLSLSSSDTAAEAEVTALLNQIESTMTKEQMDAINAMNLTSTDMMDLMQSMGGGMGSRGTPDPNSTPSFNFSGGGFEGGSPPEGFSESPPSGSTGGQRPNNPSGGGFVIQGGPMGDAGSAAGLSGGPTMQGTQDPSMQATVQARFSTQANQVNTMLLQVLISKLQAMNGVNQPTPTP